MQPPESLVCKTTRENDWFRDYNEEALLTRRLNDAGCRNVVKVYDWTPHPELDLSRIIYEYCPYGDLDMIRNFYVVHE